MINHSLLIVDDDESIIELLTGLLSLQGYRVVSASNGKEGIRKFRTRWLDVEYFLKILKRGELIMNELSSSSYHTYRPERPRISFSDCEKPNEGNFKVSAGTKGNNVVRIDLSGTLNRDNTPSIKEKILNKKYPGIRSAIFHLEKVEGMDAPAMAMLVIAAKKLQDRKINSRIRGLKKDYLNLATMLGLHLVSKIEYVKGKEV